MPELTLNISPPPPPTLVLDISPPQGPEGPQGNTGPQGPTGPEGPQPDLSADTPEDLGTAAAGVSTDASRSDHVHAMPSAADVGADPAGAASAVAGDLSTHESLTTTAHGGIVAASDARLTDARTPLAHTHGQSDVTGLVADMAAKQPLDSDLTAIAALSTTAFGRSLLEVVDAVGGRAALSAAAATHAHDGADITSGTVAPARLGSGSPDASKVLRGDGTWAVQGMLFTHTPTITNKPLGNGTTSMATPGQRASSSYNHGLSAVGRECWTPVMLDAGSYDQIGVRSTVAANSTWRIGVDAHDQSGVFRPATGPGSNLLDAGTLNMSAAAGWQILSISLTIPHTDIYWFRVLCTAHTVSPSCTTIDGTTGVSWASFVVKGWPANDFNYPRSHIGWWSVSGGSGGFLTTDHFSGLAEVAPMVAVRRSA